MSHAEGQGRRHRGERKRTLTDGQRWFVLVAGFILLFIVIVLASNAIPATGSCTP